ncbi:hypothetical protein A5888_002652 [Enterococcus sp. 9E7_DIV0242]|uniref:Uncharacterized protein n=1 Tax=Candidatus Enterococcus clewellii TaxID=1834193 RepID=A0A242K885_9ENTE|nr:hypothetical protein A5888_001415 [Enterococcus sp. 9E7_DIV0242]
MNIFEFMGEHPILTVFIVFMMYYAILNICQAIVLRKKGE